LRNRPPFLIGDIVRFYVAAHPSPEACPGEEPYLSHPRL
jgi:hypothetical protein